MNDWKTKFLRIPSEERGYIVWRTFGRSGYQVGRVRGYSDGKWEAIFDDGRGPNTRSGLVAQRSTRREAADWLVMVSESKTNV